MERRSRKLLERKGFLIDWYQPYDKVLSKADDNFIWFKGGKLNTCYNCLDRHVKNGLAKKNAIIYDSPITETKKFITYEELFLEVSKLASSLKSLGVTKGDR